MTFVAKPKKIIAVQELQPNRLKSRSCEFSGIISQVNNPTTPAKKRELKMVMVVSSLFLSFVIFPPPFPTGNAGT
jgi:hypothetical protein